MKARETTMLSEIIGHRESDGVPIAPSSATPITPRKKEEENLSSF
jgi:hypothetical protein